MRANYKKTNVEPKPQVIKETKVSKKGLKDLNRKAKQNKKARSKSSHMRSK